MKTPTLTTFLKEPPSESTTWFFGKKEKPQDYIVTTCKGDDDFLEQVPEGGVVAKHAPDFADGSAPPGQVVSEKDDPKRRIRMPLDKERRRRNQRSKMKEWWVADKMAKQCYECRMGFGVLVRKHHCRVCGQIFCSKCSSNFIPGDRIGFSDETEVRLCICCNLVWQEYYKNQSRQQQTNVGSLSKKAQGIARQASMLANTRGRTSSDVSVRTKLLNQTKNLIPRMAATPQRKSDTPQWMEGNLSISPRSKQPSTTLLQKDVHNNSGNNWDVSSVDFDSYSMAGTNAASAAEVLAAMPTADENDQITSLDDAANTFLTSEPLLQVPGSAWREAASQLTEEKLKQLNTTINNNKNKKNRRDTCIDTQGHITGVRDLSEKPRLDDSYYETCDEVTQSLSSDSSEGTEHDVDDDDDDDDDDNDLISDCSRHIKPHLMSDRQAWKSLQTAAHIHLKNIVVKLLANLVESASDPASGQQPQDEGIVSLIAFVKPIINRALWAKSQTPMRAAPSPTLHTSGSNGGLKPPPLYRDDSSSSNSTVGIYKSAPEDCDTYSETAAALVSGALMGEDAINKNDLSIAVVAAVRARVDNNPSSLVDSILGHELIANATSTRHGFLRSFEREFSNVFYNPPSTPVFDLPRIQEAQQWISRTYSVSAATASETLQLLHRRYSIFPADSEAGFDPFSVRVNITADGGLPFRVTVLPIINSSASYNSVNHLPPLIKLMGSKEEVFSFRRRFKQQFNEPRYKRPIAISWVQKEYKVQPTEAESALHYIETGEMDVGLSKLFGNNLEGFRRHFSTQFSQIRYERHTAIAWIIREFDSLRHDAECALQYIEETESASVDLTKIFGQNPRQHVNGLMKLFCGEFTIPRAIHHIQKMYGTTIQQADSALRYIRAQLFNPDLRNKFLTEYKRVTTVKHSDIIAWGETTMNLSEQEEDDREDVVELLKKMHVITKVDDDSYNIHPSLADIPSVEEAERALLQGFFIVVQKSAILSWLQETYATTHADDLFSLLESYNIIVKKDQHRYKVNQNTPTSTAPLVGVPGTQIPAADLFLDICNEFNPVDLQSEKVIQWVADHNQISVDESKEMCHQITGLNEAHLRAIATTGGVETAENAIASLFVNDESCERSDVELWISSYYNVSDQSSKEITDYLIEMRVIVAFRQDNLRLVSFPKIAEILNETDLTDGWHTRQELLNALSKLDDSVTAGLEAEDVLATLIKRTFVTQLPDDTSAYAIKSTKTAKEQHETKLKGEQLQKVTSEMKSFRKQDDAREKIDIPTWTRVLTRLSWKAARTVFPCVWKDRDDIMDIREYIKVLTIEGGTPWDSEFTKGTVIPGNVCKRNMPQKIRNPRILLVGDHIDFEPTTVVTDIGSLQGSQQQYNSVGQSINSGSWLEQLGNRVEVMRPDVVLVERSVNLKVQESLSTARIALATAISRKSLGRVHRSTQATIVKDLARIPTHYLQDAADDIETEHRLDSGAPRLGQVSLFEVRSINNKPHMYICGGDTEKGCTVVLRGLSKPLLRRLKDVVRNAAFFAHNLILETHYLCDSYCCVPRDKLYNSAPSASFGTSAALSKEAAEFFDPANNYAAIRNSTELLSASLCVDFQLPDLLHPKKNADAFLEKDPAVRKLKLLQVCREAGYLNPLCHQSIMVQHTITKHASGGSGSGAQPTPPALSAMGQDGENVHQTLSARGRAMSTTNVPTEVEGVNTKVQQQLNVSTKDLASQAHQFGHLHTGQSGEHDPHYEAPLANQAGVNADTRDAAMRPPESTLQMPGDAARELKKLVLEYYKISRNKGSDTPLIFYLAEYFSLASTPGSGLPIRQYSHNKGRITVIAEQVPEEDFSSELVLMWSYCKKCECAASPRVECSRHTLSYSFGKFLETSFYNQNVLSRTCGHSLHRDMVRCFGQSVYNSTKSSYVNVQVKFDYSPVEIYTLEFPELEIRYDLDVFNGFIDSEYKDLIENITAGYSAVKEGIDELESHAAPYQEDIASLRSRMAKESLTIAEVANKLRYGSPLSALTVMEFNSMRKSLQSSLVGWRRSLQEKYTALVQTPVSNSANTSQNLLADNMSASGTFSPDPNTSSATVNSTMSQSQLLATSGIIKKKPWMQRFNRKEGGHDRSTTLSNELPLDILDSPTNVNCSSSSHFITSPMAHQSSDVQTPPHESPFAIEAEGDKSVDRLSDSQSVGGSQHPASTPFRRIHSPQNSLDFDRAPHSGTIPVGRKVSQPNQNSGSFPLNTKSGKLMSPVLNNIGNTSKSGVLLNLAAGVDGLTVIVRLDEPTSVISYTLCSDQYKKACQPPTPPGSTRMRSSNGFASVLGGGNSSGNNTGGAATSVSPPPSPMPQPMSRTNTVDYSIDSDKPQSPLSNQQSAEFPFSISSPAIPPADFSASLASMKSLEFNNSALNIPRRDSATVKPLPLAGVQSSNKEGSSNVESLLEVLSEKMRRVEIKEFEEIHPTDTSKAKQQPQLRFACTVLCARQFAALRQYYCDGDESTFIASLSRCSPFSPTGGRTGASYYKTKDGRFVLKAIKQEEVTYFEQTMSKKYFQYVARAIRKKMPSLLIKILGVFKIQVAKTDGHNSWLLMENLFYNRNVDRMFDLKGSRRNRYQADQTAVLLDENLLLLLRDGDWLFTKEDSKERLAVGVHNDTLMLKRNQIMDYSMLLGLDDTKKEIYMGIIDYMREYDLKKQVEWVVKSSGLMGGRGQQPTVVDPTKYKERFRAAMNNYFLMLPNKATPWIIKYKKYQMLVDPGSEINFDLH